MSLKLTMKLFDKLYGVCRLEKGQPIPVWAFEGEFFSITQTSDELSVVCLQDNIPEDVKVEKEWRVLKVEGPLDFSLIGILASISSTLAQSGISIFAVSTYDTDYILVKEKNINQAIRSLEDADFCITYQNV